MIKMIWAQTEEGVIGKSNGLPWKIPQEMAHFQKTTHNQNVLMGGATFESLNRQPLKNRQNYVLTKTVEKYQNLKFDNLHFLSEIEPIITQYQGSKTADIYIIGGNQIFESFFPVADEIIRTVIYHHYDGDLKIKDFNFADFKLVSTKKTPDFEIQYFERKDHQHD